MRRNMLTMMAAVVLGLAAYLMYSHWQWLQAYQATHPEASAHEIGPLLINGLLLVPGVLMLLVLFKKRPVTNLMLFGGLICTALFATSLYLSMGNDGNMGGGMLLIMVTYPSAIVLSILSAHTLLEIKK